MENHPIPQDVTGFQFRLIGDMTVKQFAYLAGAAILAWLFYEAPVAFILRLPLIAIPAGLGLGLAFVPIEGRPMDKMFGYFIKDLFVPNQYLYQKTGKPICIETQAVQSNQIARPTKSHKDLEQFLSKLSSGSPGTFDQKQLDYLQSLGISAQPMQQPQPIIAQPQSPRILFAVPIQPAAQTAATQPIQQPIEPLLAPLQTAANQQPVQISQPTPPAAAPTQPIQPVTQQKPAGNTQLTASEFPNLLSGMAADARGNILPNMLIEIMDKDNNPVRAFKTNTTGRFASATPLLNGTYTLTCDDPQKTHSFTPITIEAKGEIIQPLYIISVDARESLRRELFGQ